MQSHGAAPRSWPRPPGQTAPDGSAPAPAPSPRKLILGTTDPAKRLGAGFPRRKQQRSGRRVSATGVRWPCPAATVRRPSLREGGPVPVASGGPHNTQMAA